MTQRAKRWRAALAVCGAALVVQLAASGLVRTRRVRGYLLAHLEQTFGRHVTVEEFSVSLLPSPQLDAEGITVGDDPAFGNEYFLRAERLSVGLRWLGLLLGRFEFGTISLTRPSLILVRNNNGRWNLERWLPPGNSGNPPGATFSAGSVPAETTNRLEKIEIDGGRLDFKLGDEKQPFAFTEVSGTIEQMAPGRWELDLEAQPWRSGVQLQSPGTLRVQGEVAGTSARLQPASLRIHWGDASLADLFRLFEGLDNGVRGSFALDATAESGVKNDGTSRTGEWNYSLQARATQIHRWDMTERSDNPRVNLRLKGNWNPALGEVKAAEMTVEAPRSNLRGTAQLLTKPSISLEIHVDSSGIQAADLLEWYRAFHPGVADGILADQYFTGGMTLTGMPLSLESAGFSSHGGKFTIPGLAMPIAVGPVRGGLEERRFVVEPVVFKLRSPRALDEDTVHESNARQPARVPAGTIDEISVSMYHDFRTAIGGLTLTGRAGRVEDALKVASAFGRPLNHGWDVTGAAQASLTWGWGQPSGKEWNGQIGFKDAKLQAAGLNLPLRLEDVVFLWKQGKRAVSIVKAQGFGGVWSGTLNESAAAVADGSSPWEFNLHADHLDAAELDRWVGPRARPNWLQRLLGSLLGGSAPSAPASALLRLVNARGQLRVDEFDLDHIKFKKMRTDAWLQDLKLEATRTEAEWAGGTVQGKFSADFSPQPKYSAEVLLDHVNLAQIPLAGNIADRMGGLASGSLQLQTRGVGRDTLFQELQGSGQLRLANVKLRGWDVGASLASGTPRKGASRWASGQAAFHVANQKFILNELRLGSRESAVLLKGSVNFRQDADLTLQVADQESRSGRTAPSPHVLHLAGPLDHLRVSLAPRVAQQPGD